MQNIRKCLPGWAPRSIAMAVSSFEIRASRRSVMQDVHGWKKWSMGTLLPKPGRIPIRNTNGGKEEMVMKVMTPKAHVLGG